MRQDGTCGCITVSLLILGMALGFYDAQDREQEMYGNKKTEEFIRLSSLNILLETPFDVIKLDRKFIENMMVSGKGRMILEQVVSMADKLNLGLLAEGVETKDQIDLLQSIGCDQVQGYYYAKPMAEDEFFELLKEQIENQ